jgi:hypothetical protein
MTTYFCHHTAGSPSFWQRQWICYRLRQLDTFRKGSIGVGVDVGIDKKTHSAKKKTRKAKKQILIG